MVPDLPQEGCLAGLEPDRFGELLWVRSPSRLLFPISWPSRLDPAGEMASQVGDTYCTCNTRCELSTCQTVRASYVTATSRYESILGNMGSIECSPVWFHISHFCSKLPASALFLFPNFLFIKKAFKLYL